ncbi:carboxypeptidase-like regulatory domain-containing protein [Bacteroides gallinaceum]|uniref:Carboxypeptidase-like regulatory domain-containing protein n=2 Tax=Bacteroides gallinaceum TaxID=1462571 RepID=A0ABT7XB73_9BACE|nr:carboxypeptidase-like regulatory domain-containing protein [Bacteroides gallinaceum]MDN0051326.1 carboxypeptidase-like regulatory domain-containing protein [Bacteroides gallinaceum]
MDEKDQSLSYANVVLLSLPDSAFVTGTVSDESGSFTLKANQNDLLLRVSSIGYTTIYNKVEKPDLGTIRLMPDAQLLGEVVVKGDLPKVQLKGDAQVTNVTGTILEKAGTGNDLLSKLPGVSAEEGTVNVFGSGTAEIYINGRKMRNASELDQLSSDNVKRVEVVRNPGARYDATVKAVVRIYTRKSQGEGFGFDNRFSTYYKYGWMVLDQFNFNYRKDKFDLGECCMDRIRAEGTTRRGD